MTCNSKTYCPYPFIGASLQSDGVILPCGQYMNEAPLRQYKTIEEARNSIHMQDMREKMLTGQVDSGCQCPAEEEAGISSMRQAALRKFNFQPFAKLKSVELFFDNVCNLKCRSCASPYSHLWYEEEKQLYGRTIASKKYLKNSHYENLDVSAIEELKIYGGEPLLNVDAENFFNRLLCEGDIANLNLELSTNATALPMPNILKVIKQCKNLRINLSVDGYGKLNEFIRSGSDWEIIVNNFRFFHDLIDQCKGNVVISVHSAISVYNVNLIQLLHNYIDNNFPKFEKSTQLVQFPIFLNIQNLPPDYKKTIDPFLDDRTRSFMNQGNNNHFDHFFNFHNKLNFIRNEDLGDLNPILDQYIKNYKTTVDSTAFFEQQINFYLQN